MLIDAGNGGAAAVRDADRIMAAVTDAGLKQIDTLITTHWHGDHYGGIAGLAARIPIRHFIDHGPNVQPAAAADEFLQKTYPTLYSTAKHTIAKPGDRIPVAGLDWRIVTSAGEAIKTSLPGGPGAGRPNPYCAGFKPQEVDKGENAQSVGSVITFGKFRVAYLGDLTWNKEFDLMCPNNRIGAVDLFVVTPSWTGDLELRSAGARDSPPGGHHEQRHTKGRTAGSDEDHPFGARPRRSLAGAFLAS